MTEIDLTRDQCAALVDYLKKHVEEAARFKQDTADRLVAYRSKWGGAGLYGPSFGSVRRRCDRRQAGPDVRPGEISRRNVAAGGRRAGSTGRRK